MFMAVCVFGRGTSHGFAKYLGKIQAVIKSKGIGNNRNGQMGVIQHAAGLFNPERSQIFLGRLLLTLLKSPEQMASADTYIICYLLNADGIRIMRLHVVRGRFYIIVIRGF